MTLPGSDENAGAGFCVAALGCHQCSVPASAANWVLLAHSGGVHLVWLLAQQWPVEGAMCPGLGGTRENVFRGHYLLLSHRSSLYEANLVEQAGDCQGSDNVWDIFLVFIFGWLLLLSNGGFLVWCLAVVLILFFPQGPRGILLLFWNYLFFGVLLSFISFI